MMINDTLKMLRAIDGATGKNLARALGISASYLSEIENGKKAPTYDLLAKYSDYFDIKLSTLILFAEEFNDNSSATSAKIRTRDILFRFIKFIDRLESNDNDEEPKTISS